MNSQKNFKKHCFSKFQSGFGIFGEIPVTNTDFEDYLEPKTKPNTCYQFGKTVLDDHPCVYQIPNNLT